MIEVTQAASRHLHDPAVGIWVEVHVKVLGASVLVVDHHLSCQQVNDLHARIWMQTHISRQPQYMCALQKGAMPRNCSTCGTCSASRTNAVRFMGPPPARPRVSFASSWDIDGRHISASWETHWKACACTQQTCNPPATPMTQDSAYPPLRCWDCCAAKPGSTHESYTLRQINRYVCDHWSNIATRTSSCPVGNPGCRSQACRRARCPSAGCSALHSRS